MARRSYRYMIWELRKQATMWATNINGFGGFSVRKANDESIDMQELPTRK
jgi:hypothetical protein